MVDFIIKTMLIMPIFLVIFALFAISIFAVTDCSTYSNSQADCDTYDDCTWKSESGGSWCENRGCWDLWTETDCDNSTEVINSSCRWENGSSGWCSEVDCWLFTGTNQTACQSNDYGLQCNWFSSCISTGHGAGEECWNITDNVTCSATAGCTWGACWREGCQSWESRDNCIAHTGFNERACSWNNRESYCFEQSCVSYTNQTDCQDNNCTWGGGYCSDPWCNDWSYTNESACLNNNAGIKCTYDNNTRQCSSQGCWNYHTKSECNTINLSTMSCLWHTDDTGWCEDVECWTWDSDKGGNRTQCESNAYNLTCVWNGPNNTTGECYQDISTSLNCSTITKEKDCMDTFYCWWDFANALCNEPGGDAIHTEWNPGCYIFDTDQTACNRIFGCNYTDGLCVNNANLTNNSLSCDLIKNSTICNTIPALSTCCSWQGSSCIKDWSSDACREQMEPPPAGASYCEDYNAFTSETLCNQIAGFPWYMPCKWNNATKHCQFKSDDVFGSTSQGGYNNIQNEQNCGAAGGYWVSDTYCELSNGSWVGISYGKCEHKFDQERNCNKFCYACEFQNDGSSWDTRADAKTACENSKAGVPAQALVDDPNAVGWCEFSPYSSQTSDGRWGECKQNSKFKDMGGTSCDEDCGACTFMGKISEGKPQKACKNSLANCEWFTDPKDSTKGWCSPAGEKSCNSACDRCYDEIACKNSGKGGNGECKWDSSVLMCKPSSGAEDMEICWDGVDNNNNDKIDCSDSQCMSDPFCGGAAMYGDFGVDCFSFSDNASCSDGGCIWINESWGTWCDMPGAGCFKLDGTNETWCENNTVTGDGACEWHSGGGGHCDIDDTQADACFSFQSNETACNASAGCTWVIDTWCDEVGGWCNMKPGYSGDYVDCPSLNSETSCDIQSVACYWQNDSWCQSQGSGAGHCDFIAFSCWQYSSNASCEGGAAATFCNWNDDPYSPGGGWCEGKCFQPDLDQAACTNTELSTGVNCTWTSGFCDPPGFGGEMGSGGGGMGMQCSIYDGDSDLCDSQTGCTFFSEAGGGFCDVNFTDNCPQYSNDQNTCNSKANCKYNTLESFCDEKPFECYWNNTLNSNQSICEANSYCTWMTNSCGPKCFNGSDTTQQLCGTFPGCRWINGFCAPSGGAGMFQHMEMGAPVMLGNDPCGAQSDDAPLDDEVDICGFGMKDMKEGWGFGIGVASLNNAALCNGVNMGGSSSGTGTNTTKFYWYLDTDGDATNNCYSSDSRQNGFEFYFKYEVTYDTTTGSASETQASYKCTSSQWGVADIKLNSMKQFMCKEIQGGMIVVDKKDLNKFPSLFVPGNDFRVYVETADNSSNSSTPTDYAGPGYASPNAIDFRPECCWEPGSDCDNDNLTADLDPDCEEVLRKGFVEYEDCFTNIDEDNDGRIGCNDTDCVCEYSDCRDLPHCKNTGVNAAGYSDTTAPELVSIQKENYYDSMLILYHTNEPANGTLIFYQTSSTCSDSVMGRTEIYDVGINNSNVREYKVWHSAELYHDNTTNETINASTLSAPLINNRTYYYKIKICDKFGNCATSACMNFKTAESASNCPFCNFVAKIGAPVGWNVSYDVNRDYVYEHKQGQVCGKNAGMKINFTDGRRVNINITKDDNTTWIAFINARLTKSGLNRNVRKVDESGITSNTSGANAYVGLPRETRDKIINNLYPERCQVLIPGTSNELWHCSEDLSTCVQIANALNLYLNASSNVGTGYRIWDVPFCEFSVWSGANLASTGDDTTTTTTSSSGGSSSSGGGGGGGASETVSFTTMSSGVVSTAIYTKSNDFHVGEIRLTPNNDFSGISLKVESRAYTPAAQDADPSGELYGYFDVTTELNDTDITEATIKFKVTKNWTEENDIVKETITLNRLVNRTWNPLETSYIGVEADGSANASSQHYWYSAKTPGFSSFAITGVKKADVIQICTPNEKRCLESVLETCNNAGTEWLKQECENGCDETNLICKSAEEGEAAVCTAGQKRCLGNILQQCNTDSSAWNNLETCEHGCDSTSLVCNPTPSEPSAPVDEFFGEGNTILYAAIIIIIFVIIIVVIVFFRKKSQ